ncbi:hypothetical protein GEMRC1_001892 [Eukaryota sp. GEM-RC1]
MGEYVPLPGIEELAVDLSTADAFGLLKVQAKSDFLSLAITAKTTGPILSLDDPSLFTDDSAAFYVKGTDVFRRSCHTECKLVPVNPLEAFSRLSLKYENNDPRWRFNYDWNYFDKQDFNIGPVLVEKPYFKSSSALFVDFDFNMYEGIKKVEARFVQELDSYIGLESDESAYGYWERQLMDYNIVTFTITILGIPIQIRINLKIGVFASIYSSVPLSASYRLTTPNAELKAGWNNYNGFFNHYSFGDLESNFERDLDASLTVIFGINATLSVTIAGAVTFNGTISPFINGTVTTGTCIDQLHLLVDLGLDLSIGMSDIVLNLKIKTFDFNTDRMYHFELVRYNIMDGCSDVVPMLAVTNALPDVAPRSYIGRMQIEGDGDLASFYIYYNRVSTELCSVVSHRKCTINDYLFLPHNQLVSMEVYRRRRFWWDSRVTTISIRAQRVETIVLNSGPRKYSIFVTGNKRH